MNPTHELLQETVAQIRSLGVQVRNADELGAVVKQLTTVQNPEATRGWLGLITTISVAGVSFGTATFVSVFILTGDWMAAAGPQAPQYCLGGLGIVWGVTGLVVLGTVLACFGGSSQTPKSSLAQPWIKPV
jgi:hypothetical protein